MLRVSSGDLQRRWSKVQGMAMTEPVTVTRKGRDQMVLLSVEEFARLKRRDRQVMTLVDFTDEDIAALEMTRAPVETAAFNHEVTD